MTIEEKLTSLGLSLPPAPKPVATYVPVMRAGNLLFLSGMLPFFEGHLSVTGKLGDTLGVEEGQAAAKLALLNALAVIKAEMGTLEAIVQMVRLSMYVACTPDFTKQPQVANGASDLLVDILGERGCHARLALSAPVLPLDAPVELELIVEVSDMAPAQDHDIPQQV